ncbi:hypothetical protein StoSoilB20_26480 [Arthrobacter sp. StoSoilB20]|nr:hypothetical protein StoSoilB20_26480 [Arthrobacter sp. StoSoilB20]
MIARRMNRILSPGPGILPQALCFPRPFTHPSIHTQPGHKPSRDRKQWNAVVLSPEA